MLFLKSPALYDFGLTTRRIPGNETLNDLIALSNLGDYSQRTTRVPVPPNVTSSWKYFFFPCQNLAKVIQCRLTVKNDEIMRVSELNSVRNEPSQLLMFLLQFSTLTIFKFVNLPSYYLFNILMFCINFVACRFHRGIPSFNFLFTFNSINNFFRSYWVCSHERMTRNLMEHGTNFYRNKILAILLLTFEHLFFVSLPVSCIFS